ncbi:MAG: glycosyltransferase family 4 protein [Candidatus Latescibacteria bacterium]|nr:glycosyltransferase family 4 protein [Candidatus Latescibacterota bacterium]
MRIGYIVPGFPADERDWFTPAIADTIRCIRTRHDVRVITLRYPRETREYTVHGIPVIAVGDRGFTTLRRGLRRVLDEHQRRPFDLLHAFWATEAGAVGAAAARRLDLPLVVTCAGGELVAREDLRYGDWRSLRARVLIRAALNRADSIVVGSASQRALVAGRKAAWGTKTACIPLGIDTEKFRPAPTGVQIRTFTILSVAGLIPVKNHRMLFRALTRLRDRPWRLDLVGDGPLKEDLRANARSLGIVERLHWHGWVHHDEVAVYYQRADAFVTTSYHEAQCVALLEGMACGLPVVSTAVGLVPEVIESGVNGVCVPCENDEMLTEGLAMFLDRPERTVAAGEHSRFRALAYDRRLMVARLEEEYEKLSGGKA